MTIETNKTIIKFDNPYENEIGAIKDTYSMLSEIFHYMRKNNMKLTDNDEQVYNCEDVFTALSILSLLKENNIELT